LPPHGRGHWFDPSTAHHLKSVMAHTTPSLRRMWTIYKKLLVEDGDVDELQRVIRRHGRTIRALQGLAPRKLRHQGDGTADPTAPRCAHIQPREPAGYRMDARPRWRTEQVISAALCGLSVHRVTIPLYAQDEDNCRLRGGDSEFLSAPEAATTDRLRNISSLVRVGVAL
jgi:hypothetical protein